MCISGSVHTCVLNGTTGKVWSFLCIIFLGCSCLIEGFNFLTVVSLFGFTSFQGLSSELTMNHLR